MESTERDERTATRKEEIVKGKSWMLNVVIPFSVSFPLPRGGRKRRIGGENKKIIPRGRKRRASRSVTVDGSLRRGREFCGREGDR
jgi:hypothetical protein